MFVPYTEIVIADQLAFVCNWEQNPVSVPVGPHNRLVELALRWATDVSDTDAGNSYGGSFGGADGYGENITNDSTSDHTSGSASVNGFGASVYADAVGTVDDESLDIVAQEGLSAILSSEARLLGKLLFRFEKGEQVAWPALPLLKDDLTEFAQNVLETLRTEVPYGTVVSYGELAAMAGRPGAARGVGQIMGRVRWGLMYPAHRVIGSGRRIGGFGVSGERMKRHLLAIEGVTLP